MVAKVFVFAVVVAAATAQISIIRPGYAGLAPIRVPIPARLPLPVPIRVPVEVPVQVPVQIPVAIDDGPAQYQFQYEVQSPLTGDYKNQAESRLNDAVQGSYSFLQPDGRIRIVDYSANDATGFNALVRYEDGGLRSLAPVEPIVV